MKVILRSDVTDLGLSGDVKDVARGFARNHLIPRGLAMEATASAIRWFEKGKERREKVREKAIAEAKAACEKLADVKLAFTRKVGQNGKLFGSVGKSDIVKSLKASGFSMDKNAVVMESTIKEIGDSEVEIRFAPDASAKVKVSVVPRS
ncbi:MAG: 50S ribosomal protein L9 [Elusimicrobiota bacterium]